MTDSLLVQLEERSYPIYFESIQSLLKKEVDQLEKENKTRFLVTDENLKATHSGYIKAMGFKESEIFVVPAGERSKSISVYKDLLSFLASNAANRDSVLFAFGGGVIGDLAGFAAASYLRGIHFYQIPTSLLAMVDSSVGGKTGINLPEGKNLVGAFWQPKAVFIDQALLETLPDNEFASGLAEVIKYGLISDKALFEQLAKIGEIKKDSKNLIDIIRRCCSIKAEVVSNDEQETASKDGRALLNLGHTFGHAIENVAGYGSYLHGEAISIGFYIASLLSENLNASFSSKDTAEVKKLLEQNGLPTSLKSPLSVELLNKAITRDKKNRASGIRYIIMKAIGDARTLEGVEPNLINDLWLKVGASEESH